MKSPLEQNYYELLEVPRDATLAEIDRAYDRARAYYGAGSIAVYALTTADELKLVQDRIDEAYLILADEKARAEYDLRIGPPSPDERPLHREVRQARVRDEAKKEADRQEKAIEAPPEPKVETHEVAAPPPAEPVKAPPIEAVATPPPELPKEPAKPEPVEAKPGPESKPAVREPTPAPVHVRPSPNREGPIPPPTMASPEPAPRTASLPRREGRPAEASPGHTPTPKPDVGADAVFTGELLRRLRESAGLTLQEIADRTKIGKPHLDNIESDRFAALPAHVYLRGFLMSLARELKLDPLRVSKSYLEQVATMKGKTGVKPRS